MRAIKTTTISILAVGLLAGSAVGVAAQDEQTMEAASFTGRATFAEGMLVEPTVSETPDGFLMGEGLVAVHTWDTSDDRLDGEVTRTVNFRSDGDFSNLIESATMELTNDGGSWVGDESGFGAAPNIGGGSVTLTGRDGYAGLTAYVVKGHNDGDGWDLKGVIFPGTRPVVPEPYVAE